MALCKRAYEQRKAPEMKQLVDRSKTEQGESEKSDRAATFECARHLLGRLAHHVRAPKQILEDAPNVPELSQSYFVRRIPLMKSVPAPVPDKLTNLESILKRMMPANDPRLHKYQEALLNLDHRLGTQDRVIDQYNSPTFKPIVHAEIQVLEYFNQNNLRFVDDDRYISCSKPACYCCHLYIRHHPLGIVEPASHQNIYANWGLPLLSGVEDPQFKHQQNMLNKMLETIRREALTQISRQTVGPPGHRDTTTGITPSISLMSSSQVHENGSLEERLAHLNIGKIVNTQSGAVTDCVSQVCQRRLPMITRGLIIRTRTSQGMAQRLLPAKSPSAIRLGRRTIVTATATLLTVMVILREEVVPSSDVPNFGTSNEQ